MRWRWRSGCPFPLPDQENHFFLLMRKLRSYEKCNFLWEPRKILTCCSHCKNHFQRRDKIWKCPLAGDGKQEIAPLQMKRSIFATSVVFRIYFVTCVVFRIYFVTCIVFRIYFLFNFSTLTFSGGRRRVFLFWGRILDLLYDNDITIMMIISSLIIMIIIDW